MIGLADEANTPPNITQVSERKAFSAKDAKDAKENKASRTSTLWFLAFFASFASFAHKKAVLMVAASSMPEQAHRQGRP